MTVAADILLGLFTAGESGGGGSAGYGYFYHGYFPQCYYADAYFPGPGEGAVLGAPRIGWYAAASLADWEPLNSFGMSEWSDGGELAEWDVAMGEIA